MSANNALQKRLLRELQDLKNYNNIHKLELVYPFNNDYLPQNVHTYYINKDTPYLKLKIDKNELIVAFNNSYPFKPPILLINNLSCNSCYKISDTKNRHYSAAALAELHRKFGFYCLCCETVMCNGSGKWSPAIHISHILDEYKKFKEIKRYLNSYCALLELNARLDHLLPIEMIEMIRDYI